MLGVVPKSVCLLSFFSQKVRYRSLLTKTCRSGIHPGDAGSLSPFSVDPGFR